MKLVFLSIFLCGLSRAKTIAPSVAHLFKPELKLQSPAFRTRAVLKQFKPRTIKNFVKLFAKGHGRILRISKKLDQYELKPGKVGNRKLVTGSQLGTIAGGSGAYLAFRPNQDQQRKLNALKALNRRMWFKIAISKRKKNLMLERVEKLIDQAERRLNDFEEGFERKVDRVQSLVPMSAFTDYPFNDRSPAYRDYAFKQEELRREAENFRLRQSKYYDEAKEFLEYQKRKNLFF